MFPTRRLSLPLRRFLQNKLKRGLTFDASPEKFNEDKNIVVVKEGVVTMIGINRPSKKNCLDTTTIDELDKALLNFYSDEESKVGIIHGTNGTFCSGYDLNEIAKCEGDVTKIPGLHRLTLGDSLTEKPVIAAVNGYAVGAGFELALMCDLRIVEETAKLGFFNKRFGIPIMSGGTVLLPRIIGYSRAMDLILTGRELTGEDAMNWGIASRVVACGSALGQSITAARTIAKYSQAATNVDRKSLVHSTFSSQPISELIKLAGKNAEDVMMTEGVQGAQRFVEGFGRHGKATNMSRSNYTAFKPLSNDLL